MTKGVLGKDECIDFFLDILSFFVVYYAGEVECFMIRQDYKC